MRCKTYFFNGTWVVHEAASLTWVVHVAASLTWVGHAAASLTWVVHATASLIWVQQGWARGGTHHELKKGRSLVGHKRDHGVCLEVGGAATRGDVPHSKIPEVACPAGRRVGHHCIGDALLALAGDLWAGGPVGRG